MSNIERFEPLPREETPAPTLVRGTGGMPSKSPLAPTGEGNRRRAWYELTKDLVPEAVDPTKTAGDYFKYGNQYTFTGAALTAILPDSYDQQVKERQQKFDARFFNEGASVWDKVKAVGLTALGGAASPEILITPFKWAATGATAVVGPLAKLAPKTANVLAKAGAEGATQAVVNTGADFTAQGVQTWEGIQDDISLEQLALTAGSSAVLAGTLTGVATAIRGTPTLAAQTRRDLTNPDAEKVFQELSLEDKVKFAVDLNPELGELQAKIQFDDRSTPEAILAPKRTNVQAIIEAEAFNAVRSGHSVGPVYNEVYQGLVSRGVDRLSAAAQANDILGRSVTRLNDTVPDVGIRLTDEGDVTAATRGLIVQPSQKLTPEGTKLTPDDAPVNEKALEKLGSRDKVRPYTSFINSMAPLYRIEQAITRATNPDGNLNPALLPQSRIVQNIHERRGSPGSSWVLGHDHQGSRSVLRLDDSSASLRYDDTGIKPLLDIDEIAIQAGATRADLNLFRKTMTELDNVYSNEMVEKRFRSVYQRVEVSPATGEIKGYDVNGEVIDKAQLIQTSRSKEELLADLEGFDGKEWKTDLLKEQKKLNDLALESRVRAGLLSNDTASLIRAANPNYTPLFRILDDQTEGTLTTQASKQLKKRKGSKVKDSVDATAALARGLIQTADAVDMNLRNRAVLDVLLRLPEEDFGKFVRESKSEIVKAMDDARLGKGDGASALDLDPGSELYITKAGNFKVYVNGKPIGMTLKDAELKDVFSHLPKDPWQASLITQIGTKVAYALREMISTLNPIFSIRNFARDSSEFAFKTRATLGKDYIPVFSSIKQLIFRTDVEDVLKELYADYSYGKGFAKGVEYADFNEFLKEIDKTIDARRNGVGAFRAFYEGAESFSQRFEMANRELEYRIARKNGASHAEALTRAKEISTNFSQRGNSPGFAAWSRTTPFMNATIQGLEQAFRSARYEPERFVKKGLIGVTLPYMMLEAWNYSQLDENGRPIIDSIDDKTRKDNFILVLDKDLQEESGVKYIKWPKGFMSDRLFTNVVGEFLKIGRLGDVGAREVWYNFLEFTSGQVGTPSGFLPVGLKQVVDLSTNTRFDGSPIVPPQVKSPDGTSDKSMEYTTFTRPSVKEASNAVSDSLSPAQMDYIVSQIFPGAGQYILDVLDKATVEFLNLPEREAMGVGGVSLINMFVETADGHRFSQDYKELWNIYSKVKPVHDQYQAYVRATTPREDGTLPPEANNPELVAKMQQYYQDHVEELMAYDTMKPYVERIKQLHKANDDVLRMVDGNDVTPNRELFGDPKKKIAIDANRKEIDETARTYVEWFKFQKEGDFPDIQYYLLKAPPLPVLPFEPSRNQ